MFAACVALTVYAIDKMELRYYQKEAVDSFINWMREGKDKPLIVLPTGTGKSVVAAEIVNQLNVQRGMKIVVAVHVKELVQQNYNKLLAINPTINAGIVSSGLKRKDFGRQVIFCNIQSAYKHAKKFGHVDLVLIDEAHMIPRRGVGMWRQFLSGLTAINAKMRTGGMSATPFRTDTGLLHKGQDPQFDGICYEYSILQALKDGYLSEIVTRPTQTNLDTKSVKKNKKDFIESELQKAVATDPLTKLCCDEILELGKDRKSWLIFSSGNAHAKKIHEYLRLNGKKGYCITTDDLSKRDKAVYELNHGLCDYIVNNMILTTGFDCPRLDLIACLRPTQSAGLWIQICGRGTRLFDGKENCLLLDFGSNLERHGPIDQISGSEWYEKKEKGEAPQKVCNSCFAVVHASLRKCPDCGYEFPRNELNIESTSAVGAVFSHQETPEDFTVLAMETSRHKGKNGKPDSMRVKYVTVSGAYAEYIFYDHPEMSYPYQQAVKWGGHCSSVEEALKKNWAKPEKIVVKKEGKYYKVIKRIFRED